MALLSQYGRGVFLGITEREWKAGSWKAIVLLWKLNGATLSGCLETAPGLLSSSWPELGGCIYKKFSNKPHNRKMDVVSVLIVHWAVLVQSICNTDLFVLECPSGLHMQS